MLRRHWTAWPTCTKRSRISGWDETPFRANIPPVEIQHILTTEDQRSQTHYEIWQLLRKKPSFDCQIHRFIESVTHPTQTHILPMRPGTSALGRPKTCTGSTMFSVEPRSTMAAHGCQRLCELSGKSWDLPGITGTTENVVSRKTRLSTHQELATLTVGHALICDLIVVRLTLCWSHCWCSWHRRHTVMRWDEMMRSVASLRYRTWLFSRSGTPQVREWVAAAVSFSYHPKNLKLWSTAASDLVCSFVIILERSRWERVLSCASVALQLWSAVLGLAFFGSARIALTFAHAALCRAQQFVNSMETVTLPSHVNSCSSCRRP